MGILQKGFPNANYSSFFKVGGVKSSICRLFEHHMGNFILRRCARLECTCVPFEILECSGGIFLTSSRNPSLSLDTRGRFITIVQHGYGEMRKSRAEHRSTASIFWVHSIDRRWICRHTRFLCSSLTGVVVHQKLIETHLPGLNLIWSLSSSPGAMIHLSEICHLIAPRERASQIPIQFN